MVEQVPFINGKPLICGDGSKCLAEADNKQTNADNTIPSDLKKM